MRAHPPRSRPLQTLRRFPRNTDAIAAIEFAMVLPVLIAFMLGGNEIARFVNLTRAITNVANSMATQLAERTTDDFNYNEAVFTFNSTMVTFPAVLRDAKRDNIPWQYDIAVTLSSIAFTPTVSGCTSNCTYLGKVVWSINSPLAGLRSCTTAPVPVADSATPSLTTLPQDVFNAGSIVVADITYAYTPVFGARFISAINIKRSVYLAPRYLSVLHYTVVSGDPGYKSCP